ncbi:MAG: hypothetical protein SVW57_13540, partial [Thermodesulfobacteriota bacterium]|nr:hypothetical protein [Thermodesulfobacteriota bacterium]
VFAGRSIGFEDGGYQIVLVLNFSFTATRIAIEAVISHHLLSLGWDMGAHGGNPFQGVEVLLLLVVC